MDYRLQVFKYTQTDESLTKTYRFAVLDFSRAKEYPANFVCMLPLKIETKKGKNPNVFGELFGEKSLDFALDLLNDALKHEKDMEVKNELERRLKLIDPKQANVVKCGVCKKTFQQKKTRRYKQNYCDECLKKRFGTKRY